MKRRYVYRSAVNGRFVSKEFAERNPGRTVREFVRPPIQDAAELAERLKARAL